MKRACIFVDGESFRFSLKELFQSGRFTFGKGDYLPQADWHQFSLGEAARQALEKMDARSYEYQSDFARRYVAQGRAEMIVRLLTVRFGTLDPQVEARIQQASVAEQDAIAERVLSACTLQQALG